MESHVSSLAAKFAGYRHLVPLLSRDDVVYLNSSYAPPSNLIVHEAMARFSHQSLHDPNPKPSWQAAVEDVRALVARYINTELSSIAFTRDTTEALGNFIRSLKFQPGDNVVILDSEHPNHAYGWMALQSAGLEVRQVLTTATGKVTAANAATFEPYVDERTRAIGLSSIMFHSGQKNDVASICSAFRPRGIHVLADLTQQVGFAPVDAKALGISAAGFSLHKGLNCPTGIACMYVDPDVLKEINSVPPIVGYGAISNARADLLVPEGPVTFHPDSRRFDHLNLSLVGAAAAKAFLTFYLDSLGPSDLEEHLYNLGDALQEACQKLGVGIIGPSERENHAPHLYILNLLDPGWAPFLRSHGVYVSHYRLGVRVSLGFYNNEADIQRLADVVGAGVAEGLPLC
ncbi:pyridoxal phosphate-dependent transferase [Lasiosphaeria hispida]|uniref:Pyridoxal phosphate-dependent transferase n=1 Tax=Lasiosphaeria hispida TaxID=260671 RepID=A0AAJ0HKM2_9PEZI|nr:pyridoxal phosphate-dependent transferase [Lasiosphaeria hispida]